MFEDFLVAELQKYAGKLVEIHVDNGVSVTGVLSLVSASLVTVVTDPVYNSSLFNIAFQSINGIEILS